MIFSMCTAVPAVFFMTRHILLLRYVTDFQSRLSTRTSGMLPWPQVFRFWHRVSPLLLPRHFRRINHVLITNAPQQQSAAVGEQLQVIGYVDKFPFSARR